MARFFRECSAYHYEELLDFVLRTYNNVEWLLMLPWRDGCAIIATGMRKREEDRLYMAWCALYPFMNADNFQSFEQFKESITPAEISNESYAEIVNKTKRMFFNNFEEGG